MILESSAFQNGGPIPPRYSKQGGNVSPPLSMRDAPPETKSLLLIMDDPDAPKGLFTHWVVFNIQPGSWFPEGEPPKGAHQARNSWGEPKYGGPQPPDREHRYFFRVFALDRPLELPDGASRLEVEMAMRDVRVLAKAEYMGRFAPPAK